MQRRGSALTLARLLVCLIGLGPACVGDPPPAELSPAQQQQLARLVVSEPPAGLERLQPPIDFSGKIHLIGYTVSPKAEHYRAGASLKVVLVWQVVQPLDAGWQQFTHLVDKRGRMVSNVDQNGLLRAMSGVTGPPLPPSRWQQGKLYLDELKLKIPSHSGPLGVAAGFYRGRERLALSGPQTSAETRSTYLELGVVKGEQPPDQQQPIKELVVPKLSDPQVAPTIDGALDEPCWSQAARTGPFVHVGNGRFNPSSPIGGNAQLLYDDTFLYVGMEVQDKTVTGGWPADAKDPHLWEKDTVEIMIDPDGDGDNVDYYEIQISPQNLVFDSRFERYNQPKGGPDGPFGHEQWSAELTSAVKIHGTMDDGSDQDQGYTVEAKLPWSAFAQARRSPPEPGDQWRLNFYAMQDNGGVAWSPILGQGNFHRASRFGRVRWGGKAK